MQELVNRAIDVAQSAGASHVEARVVETNTESYEVKNGAPVAAVNSQGLGLGVRTIANGAWGFAAVQDLTRDSAERAARQAVDIAKASATASKEPVRLADAPVVDGTYVTPHEIDPLSVPVEKKIDLLMRAERAMQGRAKIRVTQAFMTVLSRRTLFANSAGSRYDQTIFETGGGLAYLTRTSDDR